MLGDQLCREVHRSDDGDLLTEYRANGDLKAVPSAWYAQTRTLRDEWREQLSSHGWPVFEVPFDPHLRTGGVINVPDQLAATTRQSFIEIAAALGERFASDR